MSNGVSHKPSCDEVSIIATELNCRSYPHIQAPIVGRLYQGFVAAVIFEAAEWLCVYAAGRTPANPPQESPRVWISKRWTTPHHEFSGRCWPTLFRKITQHYGANKEYYKRFGLDGHEGTDIRAHEGSPVYAIDHGRVKMTYDNPKPKSQGGHNYGIHTRVGHSNAYESIYAHLSILYVVSGTLVQPGTILGMAGNTGNSFGAHLHLSIKHHGHFTNPEPILDLAPLSEELPIP